MEDIIPQNAYRLDITRRYKLVPIMAVATLVFGGLFYGIGMMIALGTERRGVDEFAKAGFAYGTAMGLFVFFLMSIMLYFRNTQIGTLYMTPPPCESIQYRMICSCIGISKQGMNGILYLGNGSLEFSSSKSIFNIKRKITDNWKVEIVKLPLVWGFNASLIQIKTDIDVISIWVPQLNPSIEQIKDNLESAIQKTLG